MSEHQSGFKSKKGRPTSEQVALIERHLLETAKKLLLTQGYRSVSMDLVASKAGISKGTLYARYPGKMQLVAAVIQFCADNWSEREALKNHMLPADLKARLIYHCCTFVRYLLDPEVKALTQLIDAVSLEHPEIATHVEQISRGFTIALLSDEIANTDEFGQNRVQEPERIARILFSAVTGSYQSECRAGSISLEELQTHVVKTIDIFWQARQYW